MKRKGFTLIELLAVIVILAIIAVIATPIIIGIVENTRKDAFQRSVELIVSATDININDKAYEENYTYTITDGVISDNVAVSNTEGMNGSITYDIEGNVKYAIHNDKWCVTKDDSGSISITDYDDSTCKLNLPLSTSCFATRDLDNDGIAIIDYLCTETDVVIPGTINGKDVKEISESAFKAQCDYDDDWNYVCDTQITSLKLPDSLESIGNYAFSENKLSGELDLSNTKLKNIGDYAFWDNEITSLKIPDSIESIGDDAFGNNNLSGELDLRDYSNLTYISGFRYNEITSVKFPDSIESIGERAFDSNKISGELDLSNLTNLTIIGDYAFAGNGSNDSNQITSVKFPNSIESIGDGAFAYNKLSGELDLSAYSNLTHVSGFGGNEITSFKLPTNNNIERIGGFAFGGNKISGELDLSNLTNLTSIGSSAFSGEEDGSGNQITSIKFPDSLEKIENYAFSDNKLSGELDFSNTNLKIIEYYAFRGSSSYGIITNQIESLKFPNSIEFVEDDAFGYNMLTSVTFYGISNLDDVTLGSNVWGWADGHNENNSIFFGNISE